MTRTASPVKPGLIALPKVRFAVTRTLEAGRGSANGPDSETSEQVIYRRREMTLWEVVAELETCDELSCSPRPTLERLDGREYAKTWTRRVDGWDEYEAVYLLRADGSPMDPRMTLWLYRHAGLDY